MSTEAPGHSTQQPTRTVAATNGQLVVQVREALDAARKAGQPTPGRPTLVRLTGATDRAARKALAELAAESTSPGDPGEEPSPTGQPATNTRPAAGGRTVAWAGFVFGSVMSVAENVLHTWLPAAHQLPGRSPGVAAQIGAPVWPIGLLLSVDVVSHVRWPEVGSGHSRVLAAPLVLDGLMVISGFALLAIGHACVGEDQPCVLSG